MRGGARVAARRSPSAWGRSPRARGSPRREGLDGGPGGAIPACAGEPGAAPSSTSGTRGDPRVRGGAAWDRLTDPAVEGRSPRARGSPGPVRGRPLPQGAIPACAGEPASRPKPAAAARGDPRVRGGAGLASDAQTTPQGRSPRARGSRERVLARQEHPGAIPACAGEPARITLTLKPCWGDPRVRGGAMASARGGDVLPGRSPRARGSPGRGRLRGARHGAIPACAGEPRGRTALSACIGGDPRVRGGAQSHVVSSSKAGGRSPRARGSRLWARASLCRGRAIPACAGEPPASVTAASATTGDPRVRGGAVVPKRALLFRLGRSPRARGSQLGPVEVEGELGAIPACAGEPRPAPWSSRLARGDPRVRGGAPQATAARTGRVGRSPRARGSLDRRRPEARPLGAIPACAGEPRGRSCSGRPARGDPRVRGGAGMLKKRATWATGRSPRARGSLEGDNAGAGLGGAIPACAGEPPTPATVGRSQGGDPRVRGGARHSARPREGSRGRSPRARGSPEDVRRRLAGRGAIPACAGEPMAEGQAPPASRGDPRVRGGAPSGHAGEPPVPGRSPRARGSLRLAMASDRGVGAIPACAGEPATRHAAAAWRGGDPRVRGGATW